MPTSTITSNGQTTVPKEVCDALDVGPGDNITWEVNGGRVSVNTERPAFWRWEGFIKHGSRSAEAERARLTGTLSSFADAAIRRASRPAT